MVVDNTVQWLQLNLKETGLPVGFEYFTMNPNIPAGSLPLQGGLYSRLAYPDLWEWVQKQTGYLKAESEWQELAVSNGGNVPFYSKGDGSTTFRVPALKCWVKGANSISEVGGYLAAGLPNIEGQSGLDASLSNPIYGNSDTVQPPSIVGLWCVKAYGTVTNVGSTDVVNISTGLAQAETRISALENHGAGATVVESYRNGTKWYRVWSDGWIEQGGQLNKNATQTVTLLKPFVDAQYHLLILPNYGTGTIVWDEICYRTDSADNYARTTTSFRVGPKVGDWYACGQGA